MISWLLDGADTGPEPAAARKVLRSSVHSIVLENSNLLANEARALLQTTLQASTGTTARVLAINANTQSAPPPSLCKMVTASQTYLLNLPPLVVGRKAPARSA